MFQTIFEKYIDVFVLNLLCCSLCIWYLLFEISNIFCCCCKVYFLFRLYIINNIILYYISKIYNSVVEFKIYMKIKGMKSKSIKLQRLWLILKVNIMKVLPYLCFCSTLSRTDISQFCYIYMCLYVYFSARGHFNSPLLLQNPTLINP